MRIIDPYREENRQVLEWLETLSDEEGEKLLEEAGILDKRGDLAAYYRSPEAPKSARPRSAQPKSAKAVRVIDPYRDDNKKAVRWFQQLSEEEGIELLKEAGILDKRGNLAARYRTPKPKSAKPRSTKAVVHKRAAS